MTEFEVRVLNADGAPSLITREPYLSADAAIVKARRIAGQRRFEVWCDDRCVYATPAESSTGPLPPFPAA